MKKKGRIKRLIGYTVLGTATAFGILKAIAIAKKPDSVYENEPSAKNPMEGKKVVFVENENDVENADGVKGHLEEVGLAEPKYGLYNNYIKRLLDVILSFGGLVVLSPLMGLISLAIVIDDPGPVFFTQKRIGKNKQYFKLHKFRSMKMSTPHDTPTHMLENPDQYITKVGKFLRAHSLDELPQIWDIFIGNMSVIGPRPALWNQDVLTAEREKYGVNEIKPGLTGWAQINGRDELEISDKAKLDGEYVKKESLLFDAKCFFCTVSKVGHDDSVVEGGTGTLTITNDTLMKTDEIKIDEDNSMFSKKKVLITGKNSYIGEKLYYYLSKYPNRYDVSIINTIGLIPTADLFKGYDVVVNTAGIAHIKETNNNRHLYYEVNKDLAVNIAICSKEAGVKQYILLSSMSVYGMTTGYITKQTKPNPKNAYGNSKLQADIEISKLCDKNFKFVCLRPPMVYGMECKGNYQLLRKIALISPLFPNYSNRRSMIYIENLCEFIKGNIDKENSGLFFPQNSEYVNTSKMVQLIAENNGKRISLVKILNPILKNMPLDLLKKVFGDLVYEPVDTVNKYDLKESIKLTEKKQ